MDYRSLIQTSVKINNFDGLEKPRTLKNPIDEYNFAIEQYNQPQNIQGDKELNKIKFEKFYNSLNFFHNNILISILIFVIIPTLMILFEKFAIKFIEVFLLVIIFEIYFGLIFLISVILLVIFIKGIYTHKANLLKVNNPLKKMVFLPELCRLINVTNKSFDLNEEDVKVFHFSQSQKENLLENSFNNRYRFTIYNQKFMDYFYDVRSIQYLLKHIIQLVSSVGFYFIFYYIINEIIV